jgi:hypothetical protein
MPEYKLPLTEDGKLDWTKLTMGTGQPEGPTKEYPPYKGWSIWSGPSGMGRSTYSAFFAKSVPPRGGLPVQLVNGGTQHNSGSLLGIQQAVDAYLAQFPKAGIYPPTAASSTAAASTSGTVSFAQAYRGHAISTLTQPGGGVLYLIDVPAGSDGSGLTSYSTMPAAQAAIDAVTPQATVQPSYQQPAYEAPAPAASVYEPQQSPGLPPMQYSVQTSSAQYDPIVSAPPPASAPAKLPLIIGGLAALGIAGFLWWKFRK